MGWYCFLHWCCFTLRVSRQIFPRLLALIFLACRLLLVGLLLRLRLRHLLLHRLLLLQLLLLLTLLLALLLSVPPLLAPCLHCFPMM